MHPDLMTAEEVLRRHGIVWPIAAADGMRFPQQAQDAVALSVLEPADPQSIIRGSGYNRKACQSKNRRCETSHSRHARQPVQSLSMLQRSTERNSDET